MGISLALPSAMPHEGNRETTGLNLPDLGRLTDGDLIRRVARRDANAFEALYHRFCAAGLRPGAQAARRPDARRGCSQETFAAVWRSARTYKPDRGAGAPGSTRSRATRSSTASRSRTEPPGEVPDIASTELGPDERAEASYVSWRVHRALESLSPNERDVIELAYYGGLSQSEVADFLGIPLGTVKTRTRAGLGRLADLLEGELQVRREPDFDQLIGSDVPAEERERASACPRSPRARGPAARAVAGAGSGAVARRVAATSHQARSPQAAPDRRRDRDSGRRRVHPRPGDGSELDVSEHRTRRATGRNESRPQCDGILQLGKADADGNWPMDLHIKGLDRLPKGGYYDLYLTKGGKPVVLCSTFNSNGGEGQRSA
mgnify:CR=1 FL=1